MSGGMKFEWNPSLGPKLKNRINEAQVFVDSEVVRLGDPYVPMDTGVLKTSAELATEYGSGIVIYDTPYAKKQYYNNAGNGMRGQKWFERMKADHLDEILDGAAEIAGGTAKK